MASTPGTSIVRHGVARREAATRRRGPPLDGHPRDGGRFRNRPVPGVGPDCHAPCVEGRERDHGVATGRGDAPARAVRGLLSRRGGCATAPLLRAVAAGRSARLSRFTSGRGVMTVNVVGNPAAFRSAVLSTRLAGGVGDGQGPHRPRAGRAPLGDHEVADVPAIGDRGPLGAPHPEGHPDTRGSAGGAPPAALGREVFARGSRPGPLGWRGWRRVPGIHQISSTKYRVLKRHPLRNARSKVVAGDSAGTGNTIELDSREDPAGARGAPRLRRSVGRHGGGRLVCPTGDWHLANGGGIRAELGSGPVPTDGTGSRCRSRLPARSSSTCNDAGGRVPSVERGVTRCGLDAGAIVAPMRGAHVA
jgi:hypothetical protein